MSAHVPWKQYRFEVIESGQSRVYIDPQCPYVISEVKAEIKDKIEFRSFVRTRGGLFYAFYALLRKHAPGISVFISSIVDFPFVYILSNRNTKKVTRRVIESYRLVSAKGLSHVPFWVADSVTIRTAEGAQKTIRQPIIKKRIEEDQLLGNVLRRFIAAGDLESARAAVKQSLALFEEAMQKGIFPRDISILRNIVIIDGQAHILDAGDFTTSRDAIKARMNAILERGLKKQVEKLKQVHPQLAKDYEEEIKRIFPEDNIKKLLENIALDDETGSQIDDHIQMPGGMMLWVGDKVLPKIPFLRKFSDPIKYQERA